MNDRVTIYVRQQCHLCEVAVQTAREVAASFGTGVRLVDIDTDPQLREDYTDQVPVTFVDGRRHDYWRVDPERLRHALESGRGAGS
ncbi:MAG TPA: glutaredoxin family protein [Candidatus Avipropionibacterium avicola]|uniref:Glutaredoxin family protein n=1 Tax=Candidatus Avipropionibacterium avicola TaxID=2840701 RepID=A0A9D1GYV0_9ACTN|nr:glutaredoxin family protein [Candidatus Avipropionibacterium avicola]